jgi:hypothetical protein
VDASTTRHDPREHRIWPGQWLDHEDPRLRVQTGGEQRELGRDWADVDHARKLPPGEGARVLDARGDAVAQPGTKAALGHEAQPLVRAPHDVGCGPTATARFPC